MVPEADITVTVAHLCKQEEEERCYQEYKESDYILAQRVSDDYFVEFLRSSRLREEFPHKVLLWPNIFFRGQCPDLCHLSLPDQGRVLGPLGIYQNRLVFEAWRESKPVSVVRRMLTTGGDWLETLEKSAMLSLAELKERESECDVTISPVIEEHWLTRRLFFTFNHPSRWLLEKAACRLLRHIDRAPRKNLPPHTGPEPLDRIIPALLPVVAKQLGLQLPAGTTYKGCAIEQESQATAGNRVVYYQLDDFIETSYRALDKQLTPDTTVRVS